jgi:hypothetical protein
MRFRLLTTISIGLLSAACQSPYQQQAARLPPVTPPISTAAYSTSEQACNDYGFATGSGAFDRCVQRERAARAAGRVNQSYAEARLTADARDACSSYGLEPGMRYDRCVAREIEQRVYRGGASQPAQVYRTDASGNRFDSDGYRVDANGHRLARAPSFW